MNEKTNVVIQELKGVHTRNYVGARIKKKHAYELVQGRGNFADDVEQQSKTYYVHFVRSPYARAKILKINYEKALGVEGVVRVFTGPDFKDINLGYWMHLPKMMEPARHPLAVSEATYNGEPVAAVLAVDPYIAEDAAELVDVDYEVLEPVLDPIKALEDSSNKVMKDMKDNVLFEDHYRSVEELEKIIDECPVKIEEKIVNGRSTTVTLEPRVQVATYNGDVMEVWSSTQYPHVLRTFIAESLGIPENHVRVYAQDVGGGFGPKTSVFNDDMTVYAISYMMKITVKWVETRTEDVMLTGHERDQIHFVKAGFEKNGKLVAVYDRIIADVGAGTTFWAEVQPAMVASVTVPGPYLFRNYGFDMYCVTTNKTPWSPNIGFGRPVAALVMERLMDMAALKLKMDPVSIREMNLVHKEQFPYRNPAGVVYDSGDYRLGLKKLTKMMGYDKIHELREKMRQEGKLLGVGISVYSEYTAPPSSRLQGVLGWHVGGYEKATIRMNPTGKVNIYLGVKDSGQGHETIFAQIAADELGISIDDIYVNEGDTDRDPYGFGSWASRSTVTAGNAVLLASRKMRDRLLKIAAHFLKADEEDLEISNGEVKVTSDPERRMGMTQLASMVYRQSMKLPSGIEPDLEFSAIYDPPQDNTMVSYAWHGVLLEIDPETGQIKLLKYYVVDDAGVIINPLSAEGQVHGSTIAHGLQQALAEIKYDDNGILLTTSFWDYIPISSLDLPETFEIENIESPSPTPGGYKGMGEGGAIGCPPAIANAISNAVAEFGSQVRKIPISMEEIFNLIKNKGRI